MSKQYHALLPGHIYCGGVNDIQQMVDEDGIEVVVDLRAESTGCAAHQPEVQWVHISLSDHAEEPEEQLFHKAIFAVVDAYQKGEKGCISLWCRQGANRNCSSRSFTGIEDLQIFTRGRRTGQIKTSSIEY